MVNDRTNLTTNLALTILMGGTSYQNYLPPCLMPTAQDIWIATWIRNRAGQDHSQTLPELDCFDHFFQGVLILASQSKSITCIQVFTCPGCLTCLKSLLLLCVGFKSLELQKSLLDTALMWTHHVSNKLMGSLTLRTLN